MATSKSSKQHKQADQPKQPKQPKQPWEYDTITEVIHKLKKRVPEEQTRYLMIGAGIVRGSWMAYEEQDAAGKKGYWANQITDQAAEAGLIAENIKEFSANGNFPSGYLEEIEDLREVRIRESWSRPYGIIRTEQPYSSENLQKLGEHIERCFSNKSSRQRLQKSRQISALQDKALQDKKENKERIYYQRLKSKLLVEEESILTKHLIELYKTK